MSVSEAKKKANAKWNASKDNIMIRPDKETGAAIRAAAAAAGQSNQQYILQATAERMAGGNEFEIDRAKVNRHIEETGETAPEFVNRAIDETIVRDEIAAKLRRK